MPNDVFQISFSDGPIQVDLQAVVSFNAKMSTIDGRRAATAVVQVYLPDRKATLKDQTIVQLRRKARAVLRQLVRQWDENTES